MNEEIVWLYSVIDTKEMSAKDLQSRLDYFSNHVMPHEIYKVENGLIIIRFESGLKRQAYFAALTADTLQSGS